MDEVKPKLDVVHYLNFFNKEYKCTVMDIVFYIVAIVTISLEIAHLMRLLNWNVILALKMLGVVGISLLLFWWSVLTD